LKIFMKKLKIHYLQHVSFEDLGCIEDWALHKKHFLSSTKFHEHFYLPDLSEFDWLIIIGGPMGVYDTDKYKWLPIEIDFIKTAIENGKTVIGICLGSQLIATALGSKVYPNTYKEIGWFPIQIDEFGGNPLFNIPQSSNVFHWHGDTFDLPDGAIRLASSEACPNQAFLYKHRVIGLQFHLEVTESSIKQMIENGSNDLKEGKYIQSIEEINKGISNAKQNNKSIFQLLDYIQSL
jgi:GMP synthase-like glutamine amidotransferase